MHLISSLVSGVYGAENGTAVLFRRGTSLRVGYYTDFVGSEKIYSDIQLDSNGSAVVYVTEIVDVRVYNSGGSLVREFTEVCGDANIEVTSQSFTGTSYITGSSGPGLPTTLRSILDKWIESAGARDFRVKTSSGDRTIRQILGSVSLVFFSVKSSAYGARGDDSTDDSDAIEAAGAAAEAAGGGTVFFPAGTYRVSYVNFKKNVNYVGVPGASFLRRISGARDAEALCQVETVGNGRVISGIGFLSAIANNYEFIALDENENTDIENCSFGDANASGSFRGHVSVDLSGENFSVRIKSCEFKSSSLNGICLYAYSTNQSKVWVEDSVFTAHTTGVGNTLVTGPNIHLKSCLFDLSACSVGTVTCMSFGSVGDCRGSAIGVEVTETGGATGTVFSITPDSATDWFEESSTVVAPDTGLVLYSLGTIAEGAYCKLGSREHRYAEQTDSDGSSSVPALTNGVVAITVDNAGDTEISCTNSNRAPVGSRLSLLIFNKDGSTRTISFGTNMDGGSFSVESGRCVGAEFVSAFLDKGSGAVLGWYMVGLATSFAA